MFELNQAAEMARLQHEDRLRQAEQAQRYRESKTKQTGWVNRLRDYLNGNR